MQHSKILSFEEFTNSQHGEQSPEIMGGGMQMGGEPQLELPAPAEQPNVATEPEFDLTMVDEPVGQPDEPIDNGMTGMSMTDTGDDHSHS